jgi:hypothetical protein
MNVRMNGFRSWFAGMAMAVLLSSASLLAQGAQQPGAGQRGQFAGVQRVNGEVTAISGSTLTVKAEDGATYTVTATDNTRVMRGNAGVGKIADVKVGDGVMAAGNLDTPNKTLHAMMIVATDAATLKQMKDNLGKTYITGRVTAIDADNAKMTVMRPDNVSQTIGFDESTSFKRGGLAAVTMRMGAGNARPETTTQQPNAGESITLADIKVGDNVTGEGAVKAGVFVPTQLSVATPGGRRNGAGRNPSTTPATPPASTPQ